MQTTTNPAARPLRSYTYEGATLKLTRDVPFIPAPGELEYLPAGTTVEVLGLSECNRLIYAEPRDYPPYNATLFGFHLNDFALS